MGLDIELLRTWQAALAVELQHLTAEMAAAEGTLQIAVLAREDARRERHHLGRFLEQVSPADAPCVPLLLLGKARLGELDQAISGVRRAVAARDVAATRLAELSTAVARLGSVIAAAEADEPEPSAAAEAA